MKEGMEMKRISDMNLMELENEIVDLQCKELAAEWEPDAPEFTYQDWRRLLALRAAYYEIVDATECDALEE